MRKLLIVLLVATVANVGWAANNNNSDKGSGVQGRLDNAASIIQQMTTAAPDKGIPQSVLDNAQCVAVVPNEIKGAFIIGGQRGSGFASCRTAHGWSAPAPFTMTGVSWGPQIGGASRSLIMMVMNQEGMKHLMSGHFKVGGEVSAAAGPIGREASANAGWKAGILTYSHSKGAFIGASINGAGIQQDNSATKKLYGRDVSFQQILQGNVRTPVIAREFVNAVANAKESAAK